MEQVDVLYEASIVQQQEQRIGLGQQAQQGIGMATQGIGFAQLLGGPKMAGKLGFAAKFWWIILAPLVFLGGLFNKKSSSGETASSKTPKKRKSRSRKTD